MTCRPFCFSIFIGEKKRRFFTIAKVIKVVKVKENCFYMNESRIEGKKMERQRGKSMKGNDLDAIPFHSKDTFFLRQLIISKPHS